MIIMRISLCVYVRIYNHRTYLLPEMSVLREEVKHLLYITLEGTDDRIQLEDNLENIFVFTDDLVQWFDHCSRLHNGTLFTLVCSCHLDFLMYEKKVNVNSLVDILSGR